MAGQTRLDPLGNNYALIGQRVFYSCYGGSSLPTWHCNGELCEEHPWYNQKLMLRSKGHILTIPNVTSEFNNTVITCSISYNDEVIIYTSTIILQGKKT